MFEDIFRFMSVFLIAILSGLVIEFWTKDKQLKKIKFLFLCLGVYVIEAVVTILLLALILRFFPQPKNLVDLLKEIAKSQWIDFLVSFVATITVSLVFDKIKKKEKAARIVSSVLVFLMAVLCSVTYFLNSFKVITHPQYSTPVESISSIVNSRFSIYPFILSEDILYEIGDGSELLSTPDSDSKKASDEPNEYETYKEPSDFRGYIDAIIRKTFAPGMDQAEYLHKAYELFRRGKHNNDFFCIGLMWNYIYDVFSMQEDGFLWWNNTEEDCLNNAIGAYKKEEEINGGSAALYSNMAIIYSELNDRASTRECINKALEYGVEESLALSNYIIYICEWSEIEEHTLLMKDAKKVLKYQDNLSMYVLYGACAIADNKNVKKAYELLCHADEHYKGKSAIIKILRCICANLTGVDESFLIQEIGDLEDESGLTDMEELYLVRYLFAMNKYKELWGYIASVGTENDIELDVEKAVMKAVYYSKNPSLVFDETGSVRILLNQVNDKLDDSEDDDGQSDEKELLLLAQILLKSCLGESDSLDIEKYKPEDNSDIQNVICATAAFNKEEYLAAIDFCEAFFAAEKTFKQTISEQENKQEKADKNNLLSLQYLTLQEETVLSYHVHLIYGMSHYQYAQNELLKGSKEWKQYMEDAENECKAFKHTTKSLFYISEEFEKLQDSIDIANGKIVEKRDNKKSIFADPWKFIKKALD